MVEQSTVSGAYSPHLRLPCAARPRPKYAQHEVPLEMDGGDPDAVLGSWVLLERSTVEQMDGEPRWALVEREGHADPM